LIAAKVIPNVVAFDTETTGLNVYLGDRAFAVSAAWRVSEDKIITAYVSFPVDPKTRQVDYSKPSNPELWIQLQEYLADENIRKVFHNAKFDRKMIARIPVAIRGRIDDTLLQARCCYTMEQTYGLKPLSKKYLGIAAEDEADLKQQTIKSRSLAKKFPKWKPADSVEADYWLTEIFFPEDKLCEIYAKTDAERTLLLDEFYQAGMDELDVREAYEVEMELMDVLIAMEDRGVRFNAKKNIELLAETERLKLEAEKEFWRAIPSDAIRPKEQPNLNSWQQILPLLQQSYPELNIQSTSGDELEKLIEPEAKEGGPLATNYPMIYWLLMQRGYKQGLGFFQSYNSLSVSDPFCSFDDMIDNWDACSIHGNFNQGNTKTFRLSMNDPNLQQSSNPATSDGYNVVSTRGVVGPRRGYAWYCIDGRQLELRILASNANELKMIKEFCDPKGDPHNATRQNVACLASMPKDVGRKLAKNVNFSVANRGGKNVLYRKYSIPLDQGAQIIKDLHIAYPDMKARQEYLEAYGKKYGYIRTAYNRMINVDPENCYTTAPANDIQSSAGDYIKRAMIKVAKYLKETKLDAHIVLQVHDEIVIEIKQEHCFKWLLLKIKEIIEDHGGVFKVPIPCEWAKTVTSWEEKTKKGMEWINERTDTYANYQTIASS